MKTTTTTKKKIHEKSFNQQEIRRLTCYGIIISYTRSNKNINKNKKETYLRINFIFTALTYAVFLGLLYLYTYIYSFHPLLHIHFSQFYTYSCLFGYQAMSMPHLLWLSFSDCHQNSVRCYYLLKLDLN